MADGNQSITNKRLHLIAHVNQSDSNERQESQKLSRAGEMKVDNIFNHYKFVGMKPNVSYSISRRTVLGFYYSVNVIL